MVRRVSKKMIALAVVVVLLIGAGCATPTMRHVEAVDSSADSVKFLYSQRVDDDDDQEAWEQGIIECRLEEDRLTECRRVEVEYR